MTRVAVHTEVHNDDGSLAGHVTYFKEELNGKKVYTVRSVIPEEDLDITQDFPHEAYAATRYATMIQKVKTIAIRNKKK